MENIATLSGAEHQETQSLLPWYVSQRLDASDGARVEAHLAQCPECRADVAAERGLAAEWASLPMESETSWLRLRGRLAHEEARRANSALFSRLAEIFRDGLTRRRSWFTRLGWGLAVAQGAALAAIGIALVTAPTVVPYHALGAGQAPAVANALVMFDPDTSERRLREALTANHARIVDGPTTSGAYVVHVPADERSATLARMRALRDVVLAQPIDPGAVR
jgi:anti-sigma factor RsiW